MSTLIAVAYPDVATAEQVRRQLIEATKEQLLSLQDAETGELVEVDTSDAAWRASFAKRMAEYDAAKKRVWNAARVDRIELQTPDDHVGALVRFFQRRIKRLAH